MSVGCISLEAFGSAGLVVAIVQAPRMRTMALAMAF